MLFFFFFFFKQKTAYEMRISDWSSDVCSSDLRVGQGVPVPAEELLHYLRRAIGDADRGAQPARDQEGLAPHHPVVHRLLGIEVVAPAPLEQARRDRKSTRLNSSH